MSDNTNNENEIQEKFEETKIEIQLRTGFAHKDKFEEAQTQIDFSSYYIGSIFWFIRVAIEAESLLELQTGTRAYNESQFREHIQFLVQIGEGLCEWLPDYSSSLRDYKRLKTSPNPVFSKPIEQTFAKNLDEHHLQIKANKIAHILQSDKVSADLKDVFISIICEAGTESGIGGSDHPEVIKTSFPLIINSLDSGYAKGVLASIRSLIDNNLPNIVQDELKQYETRFDGKTEDELNVLDLSNSSVEDLAKTLYGLMHNPNLPKPIKECLEDRLNGVNVDLYSSENILENLKDLSKEK